MKLPIAVSSRRENKRLDLAYAGLASSELARDINRDIILELIRSRQPISRADLSRVSGLQASTVSLIAAQLLKEGWITEGAAALRPRGRRPTLLSLNDKLVIFVVDLRPIKTVVALIDLFGRFLAQETIPFTSDPSRLADSMAESMRKMQRQYPDMSLEGIGISVPGRVDPDSQKLILSPNLKWPEFDLKAELEKRMRLQVELDNAANACLLSELWFGRMDGIRNAVLLTISEGVGTAILMNGQIVVGEHGLAGEFGHIPVDTSGPRCGCGQTGCWETFASSRAAVRYYTELAPKEPAPTIHELLNLAEEGDTHAIAAVQRHAEALGAGLRLITAALSPALILITGDITSAWARYGPVVEKELASRMLAGHPPKLTVTNDGELGRLRGAAAVVLQRHSGYHRSTHARAGHRTRRKKPAAS